MRHLVTRLVSLGLMVGLGAVASWAGTQARLLGTVKDTAGNPVAGAVITLSTDEVDGFEKRVEVKDDGSYTLLLLDATRTYTFRVEAPGHLPHVQPFKVAAGSTDNVFDFVLKTEGDVLRSQQDQIKQQPGFKELSEASELLREGRKAEAEARLEAAVAILPDTVTAWASLAELAYERGDHAAALERARTCLRVDSEALACLGVAANAAKALGDEQASADYLTRYQKLNPDDPAAIFNQAAAYINSSDDAQARPLLERCLEADPDFPKCLFEYGMLLLRSGDMEGAKAQLQRYLEVAPDGDDAATARDTLTYL
jgi:Flp pilus assembly protein TadD